MSLIFIAGVDITHTRLVDLTELADQARPFYDWVQTQFQSVLHSNQSLDKLLISSNKEDILLGVETCYGAKSNETPLLFDGIGRTYPHRKACYYFFSW